MKRSISPFDLVPLLAKANGHDTTGNKINKELDNDEENNVIRSWDEFDASTKKNSVSRGPPRIAIIASVFLLFVSGVMIASRKNAQRNYEIVQKNTENAIFSQEKREEPTIVSEVLSPPVTTTTSSSESINDQSSDHVEPLETTTDVVKEEENKVEETVPEEEEQEVVTKKEKKNTVVKEFGKGATR